MKFSTGKVRRDQNLTMEMRVNMMLLALERAEVELERICPDNNVRRC